jgi:putative SOS response-associated peptidase YedK
MCGRYVTITKVKEVEKRFGVTATQPDLLQQTSNLGPGQLGPVITNDDPKALQFFKFGYTPFWAKKQTYVINARSEGDQNPSDDPRFNGAKGIISKPMFRHAIRSKRCLVIADAFLEGPKQEKLSKPYCVYMRDGKRPFAFAGIWDEWTDPSSGEIIKSFAIITTPPNEVLTKLGHHRCPAILHPDEEKLWLDQDLPLSDITSLLRPFPADEMNAYPISADIKNPRNNGLHLLKPLGERIVPEYDYELFSEIKLEGMGAAPARQRRLFEDE